MNPLYRQAIVQSVAGLAFLIALGFLCAGTWDSWQGWVFLAVFAASTFGCKLSVVHLTISWVAWRARLLDSGRSLEELLPGVR